ncbi:olfactory receptor 4K2-like [Austrofundulus limnaeus]|uniref:Olfactory receptor 4K2-like n=1 Tax=Austrofundulus limnaeus TaxID=52670 RepID=A0A2I4B2W8_AUSLI|nr:PREDICTED: olfactory receptor 4K2-like [Austrofundulus limnaeus]
MNVTEVSKLLQFHVSVKVLLSVLPCLLFLYVNSVMMFALLKKPFLLESPRYILFGHLLLIDSLQLLLTTLLYLFGLTMIRMVTCLCVLLTQLAAITVKLSPINLAAMSLERYVAICFPLRHASVSTPRVAAGAIAVMWTVSSIESFTQLFLFFSVDSAGLMAQRFCSRNAVFQLQVCVTLNRAFTILNFVLVTIIIVYTYVAIVVSVKRPPSCARGAKGEQKTVLLHVFQLCLYLVSTLFNMISSSELLNLNAALTIHIEYIFFFALVIFPKFLSPLIYGLRDQSISHVLKYCITFGCKSTVRPNA